MSLTRRDLFRSATAAGALLIAGPAAGSYAASPDRALRRSRLHPDGGLLVHTDLHNHTLLSDGAARADEAFAQLRAAGLDVAALTDHAVMGKTAAGSLCASGSCTATVGINEASWQRLAELADAANVDNAFVAMRGFEWTTASLGHVNVWFSETWTDAASVGALAEPKDAGEVSRFSPVLGPELRGALAPVLDQLPRTTHIDGFYDWLAAPPDRPIVGGGLDALAGFNHPGSYGDFEDFRYMPAVADRMVSVEAFSFDKGDYLYEGVGQGKDSPLVRCLDRGWRTGMLGVSDEHRNVFGSAPQARAGLYVRELSGAGVREALLARRFFATREPGVRLDTAANGVRMGSTLGHRSGRVRIAWDFDGPVEWRGRRLLASVLSTGSPLPRVLAQREFVVPDGPAALPHLDLSHDVEDGRWLLLRITDSDAPADPRALGTYVAAGNALAYASPFFLDPDVPAPVPQ